MINSNSEYLIVSEIINRIFKEHPSAVQDAKSQEPALNFLVGLTLKEMDKENLVYLPSLVSMTIRYKLIHEA